ncbi:MAG: YsnF/AvaK domain-containing protein [Silvibacterium sp.]|nr:YsnF/AvaK domain-containing protein [Silvibacterium sp.]
MATTSTENIIMAYFRNDSDAENAIRDLQSAGFRSDQIGSSYDDSDLNDDYPAGTETYGRDTETRAAAGEHDHRSFWEKVKDFFSGESDSGYETRETGKTTTWDSAGMNIPARYYDRMNQGGGLISVRAEGREAEAEQILIRNHGEIDRESASGWQQQSGAAAYSEVDTPANSAGTRPDVSGVDQRTPERRIQLISEVLRVNKERVAHGEVRLKKQVQTETQNIQVPVTREEIVIERTPVSGERPAADAIGADQEITVPLTEEQVRVEKVPVVREEVRVGKKPVSDTQNVSDQVRREELQVEGSEGLEREGRKSA